jgi:hypothetical protein
MSHLRCRYEFILVVTNIERKLVVQLGCSKGGVGRVPAEKYFAWGCFELFYYRIPHPRLHGAMLELFSHVGTIFGPIK